MTELPTYFIVRQPSTSNGTFGTFYDDKSNKLCLTVELPWLDNTPQISCIPSGTYQVSQYASPKHGLVWQILGVPDRSNIEIHPANDINDLLGCVGVGNAMGEVNGLPAVLNSQITFSMLKLKLPDSFTLDINWGNI